MIRHYIQIFYEGFLLDWFEKKELCSSDVIPNSIPDDAIGYRFYDEVETLNAKGELTIKKQNFSGMFYFGEEYSLEQLRKKYMRETTIIFRMEKGEYDRVVKIKNGTWRMLGPNDTVI